MAWAQKPFKFSEFTCNPYELNPTQVNAYEIGEVDDTNLFYNTNAPKFFFNIGDIYLDIRPFLMEILAR